MANSFRGLFALPQRIVYLGWRLLGRRFPIQVRTRSGLLLSLRPYKRTCRDWAAAYEVFVLEAYSPMSTQPEVRKIVDLGANVGFATLYFAKRFPSAQIHSFEPHPLHYCLLTENLRMNGLDDKVRLYNAAVGARKGSAYLTDADLDSTLTEDTDAGGAGAHAVQVLDFFACMDDTPIDVLKLDIEGSEWAILADERFTRLRPRNIVMEWHAQKGGMPNAREWLMQRLAALGYRVEIRSDEGYIGTLAACVR
ncbi:MAG: FkbM family methyltransferase [Acidobacteria bacterium]|nr:FkbM family methyltransferase [Acidobacteriota bacterium]